MADQPKILQQPGETPERAGLYREVGPRGGRPSKDAKEVRVKKTDTLPKASKAGNRWRFVKGPGRPRKS